MSNSIKHISAQSAVRPAISLFPNKLSLNILPAMLRSKQRKSQRTPPLKFSLELRGWAAGAGTFSTILFFFQFIKSPPCVSKDKSYLLGRYYKYYKYYTQNMLLYNGVENTQIHSLYLSGKCIYLSTRHWD